MPEIKAVYQQLHRPVVQVATQRPIFISNFYSLSMFQTNNDSWNDQP